MGSMKNRENDDSNVYPGNIWCYICRSRLLPESFTGLPGSKACGFRDQRLGIQLLQYPVFQSSFFSGLKCCKDFLPQVGGFVNHPERDSLRVNSKLIELWYNIRSPYPTFRRQHSFRRSWSPVQPNSLHSHNKIRQPQDVSYTTNMVLSTGAGWVREARVRSRGYWGCTL